MTEESVLLTSVVKWFVLASVIGADVLRGDFQSRRSDDGCAQGAFEGF